MRNERRPKRRRGQQAMRSARIASVLGCRHTGRASMAEGIEHPDSVVCLGLVSRCLDRSPRISRSTKAVFDAAATFRGCSEGASL